MVWGGRALGEVLGKVLPTEAPYGESWEISDHASHHSVVASGPQAGKTLHQLMAQDSRALLGDDWKGTIFPWLVKFLDAHDWLSVQVHPDETAVKVHWPSESSKTEVWFIMDAAPTSKVYAGLRPGVDEKRLRQALVEGTVADCLHQFTPRPGDCLFLPAGTVHAVGGGVLIAEVQETSDATFRLFDWHRKDAQGKGRTLHVNESLACINWQAGPVHPVHAEGYPAGPGKPASPGPVRQVLTQCRYFEFDYQRDDKPWHWGGKGRMQVALVVHGQGRLESEEKPMRLTSGDCLVLPANHSAVRCRPEGPLGVLLATLPGSSG
jgi:mannose-6-phosphate isomerase